MKLPTVLIISFLSLANIAYASEYLPERVRADLKTLDSRIAVGRAADFEGFARSTGGKHWDSLTPHILAGNYYHLYADLVNNRMVDPPTVEVVVKLTRDRQIPDSVLIKLVNAICSEDHYHELADAPEQGNPIFTRLWDAANDVDRNALLNVVEDNYNNYLGYLRDNAQDSTENQ